MHDSRRRIAEAQSINAMREILSILVKHRTNVDMSARKMQTLSANDMEIAGYLVERQRTMNATGVKRFGRFVGAFGQIVGNAMVATIGKFFED